MNNRNETRVSLFPSARRDQGREATLEEIANAIRDPGGTLEKLTLRAKTAPRGKLENIKRDQIPAAAFGGIFRGRRDRDLLVPSGLVLLELPAPGSLEPGSQGTLTEACVLAYRSLTQRGTKVLMAVSPRPRTPGGYRAAQKAAVLQLTQAGNPDVLAPAGISRTALLAYDPNAYVNLEGAVPVRWEPPEPGPRETDFDEKLWILAVRMAHRNPERDLREHAREIYGLLLEGPDPGWEPYVGTEPPGPEEDELT